MNLAGRPRTGYDDPEVQKRVDWLRSAGINTKIIINYRLNKPMPEDGFRAMLALAMRETGKYVSRPL